MKTFKVTEVAYLHNIWCQYDGTGYVSNLMREHVLAQEGVLLQQRLLAGGRERRGQPAQRVARVPQRARQPAQRELHVVRRQAPTATLVYLQY